MSNQTDESRVPLRKLVINHQEKRRADFLARSKQARSDALQRSRHRLQAVLETSGTVPASAQNVNTSSENRGGGRATRPHADKYYAGLLMSFEWLLQVPDTLGTSWRVVARPEGKRCLLIASHGRTVSRLKNGQVLHIFPSALTNGSRRSRGPQHVFSMFDAVFHEPDQTYYVLDVLAWNGMHLCGSTIDARMLWTRDQFALSPAAAAPHSAHRYCIRFCDVAPCHEGALRAAYEGPLLYQRDGLLLLHADCPYVLESNPFALVWKDPACSRWATDTDEGGEALSAQELVLAYRSDGAVVTGDDASAVALGRMPDAIVQQFGAKLREGLLLRFQIGPAGVLIAEDGCITGADLRCLGVSKRQGRADSYSRIVFQWQQRTGQAVSIHQLLAAVRHADDRAPGP